MFNLEGFLSDPSVDQIDRCRKKDLYAIAAHFSFEASAGLLKAELKEAVVQMLVHEKVFGTGSGATASEPTISPSLSSSSEKESREEVVVERGLVESRPVPVDTDANVEFKPPHTVPRFSPFSLPRVSDDARHRLRIARLQLEAQEKDRDAEYSHKLAIRKMELEMEADTANRKIELEIAAEKEVKLKRLELEAASLSLAQSPGHRSIHSGPSAPTRGFEVSRNVVLVPQFREAEVDAYFTAFERVATSLKWPKEVWSILLQCKLTGKAQEIYAALSLEESLCYESIKTAVLRAYELVPEAYRQKFRTFKKMSDKTFVEFAREKETLFNRWCKASNAVDFNTLSQLVLIEEFKNSLPDRIVTYLNEQKVGTLAEAAVLADVFVLSHKQTFVSPRYESRSFTPSASARRPSSPPRPLPLRSTEERECFYCHQTGHVKNDCFMLKRKLSQPSKRPKEVLLVRTLVGPVSLAPEMEGDNLEPCYKPFMLDGLVSLSANALNQCPVRILRDTGAAQSFILSEVLPFSNDSLSGSSVLVQGIEMGFVSVPLHEIHLSCDLANGVFKVGVRPSLPVRGVTFLLGNDIAGGKVMPVLEVLERPEILQPDVLAQDFPEVFPVCVVTRAQARSLGEAVVLSDTLFATELTGQTVSPPVFPQSTAEPSVQPKVQCDTSTKETTRLPMIRSNLIAAQKEDVTLVKCFDAALAPESAKNKESDYFVENDLLMRRWKSRAEFNNDWTNVFQIVVPTPYRQSVLSLAHEHLWSGHLGITKTYDRVLRQFFWPGLKRDVSLFCRTCHVCQVTGKPNQVIKPAPLHPVPAIGEPFEHVLVDCVGPLPKTKSGNQFLLTIMCVATRYPEAIPLRSITAQSVVKALIKFFSTFGLPKIVQTDQGTNFLSGIFEQVLTSLSISHRISSAYHPESQGALERWHQTFKSVLRKYTMESGREWDEGVPLALFAVREIVQESLGFSPAELVFGHTVRGPLRMLRDQLTGESSPTQRNVLTYVSRFRERLHEACSIARESLSVAQQGMKRHFDKKALPRSFQAGDLVLVLLPIPGSSMSARFSGPYTIDRSLSETDYVVRTPDRRRKTRVCHINMLKKYYTRGDAQLETRSAPLVATVAAAVSVAVSPTAVSDEDGLSLRNAQQQTPRLTNSEMLLKLPSLMHHLSREQEADLLCLISEFPCLFGDVPTRTTVLEHDIDVGESRPTKQHPYRVNAYKRSLMKKEVDYLLEHNLAQPSSSPWSSPCLLVPKPDATVRFCTDYRKVNNVTVPDSFPMPRVDDCVDTIGSARFVTKLDLLKGYWQVPLSPRASAISAFVTPDNFLQYCVMAFGMRNAPATFQRLVNIVFSGVPNCTAYLDDVVIHSSEWPAHVDSLRTVFQRLADASLTLNLAKCEFGKATVTYLGKQVGGGQVRPLEAKIAAITSFPVPTTRRELRRFLGMTGYYRGFCRNFSSVAAPMTDLISPLVKFVWSDRCQIAFECCKALLCNAPVLSAPDFDKPFAIEVDASCIGAGAVLTQMDSEGLVHPVGFFSKKFNSSQMRYSTIEQETLALLLALQFFEVYVGSSAEPVVIYTDHNPLVFLHRMHNQNQRLMRWSLVITNYNLVIHHKKGTENVFADALSRV